MAKKPVEAQEAKPVEVKAVDAFAAALESDKSGIKSMYDLGVLSRAEAIERLRRVMDLPESL